MATNGWDVLKALVTNGWFWAAVVVLAVVAGLVQQDVLIGLLRQLGDAVKAFR